MFDHTNGHLRRLRRLYEYEATVARLFPNLPSRQWSISKVDALILGEFFELFPRKAVVLDIGTFVGMSAFYFATQPKVLKVISVDPNPRIADEIDDKVDLVELSVDVAHSSEVRVLDLARAALREFVDEERKIQLRVGIVGSSQIGIHGDPLQSLERVEVPALERSEGASLVAFIDGLHTSAAVQADLEAVFRSNPRTIAFLHDCHGYWGPSVRAGIASFMEASQGKYCFHLFERLGFGFGAPNLGVVYPNLAATEVARFLQQLQNPISVLRLALVFGIFNVLRKLRRRQS